VRRSISWRTQARCSVVKRTFMVYRRGWGGERVEQTFRCRQRGLHERTGPPWCRCGDARQHRGSPHAPGRGGRGRRWRSRERLHVPLPLLVGHAVEVINRRQAGLSPRCPHVPPRERNPRAPKCAQALHERGLAGQHRAPPTWPRSPLGTWVSQRYSSHFTPFCLSTTPHLAAASQPISWQRGLKPATRGGVVQPPGR
jgi:hypothetical protein